jgi:hypothetical protein
VFGRVDQREAFARSERPEILGETIALFDDDTFADFVYFRSEAEARAGEKKQPIAEQQELIDDWMRVVDIQDYFDLVNPTLATADS